MNEVCKQCESTGLYQEKVCDVCGGVGYIKLPTPEPVVEEVIEEPEMIEETSDVPEEVEEEKKNEDEEL